MEPKVSIIMPAYNAQEFIEQAIDSALKQTEENIEIVIVDDCSTDSTVDIIQSFSDKRIKFFLNDHNQGASYSRNRALNEACGQWVTPLDADDWYAPERIEKLLQVANEKSADLVADDLYFVQTETQQVVGTLFCVDPEYSSQVKVVDPTSFVLSNMKPARQSPHLGLAKPLIKRSFILQYCLEYDGNVQPVEDYHLYMMCLLKGANFVTTPEPYYFYRRSRQGSTSTKSRLKLLEQNKKSNLLLLEQAILQQELELLLNEYLSKIGREIEYYTAIQTLKNQGILAAISEILYKPKHLQLFIKYLPEMIQRQLGSYIG